MKHLFIPYELAVIAKEKGFNEYCLGEYTKHAKTNAINLRCPKYEGLQGDWPLEHEIEAPLYQQIVDWFRKEHDIKIILDAGSSADLYYLYKSRVVTMKYGSLDRAIEEAFKLI